MKRLLIITAQLILVAAIMLFPGCKTATIEPPPVISISPEGKIIDKMALYWQDKVAAFREANKTEQPGGIVLLGDSITEGFPVEKMFPGQNVINRGISGDKIGGWKYHGVLDRLDVSVYDLKPKKLFLLIGINDIIFWKTPPAEMEKGYQQLLSTLNENCPHTKIYIQSLLPLRDKYAPYNRQVLKFNEKIRQLTMKHGFTHLDINPAFSDKKGKLKAELTYDGLHLTQAGYNRWAQILQPLF